MFKDLAKAGFIAAGVIIAYIGLVEITKNINASCRITTAAKDDCCKVICYCSVSLSTAAAPRGYKP